MEKIITFSSNAHKSVNWRKLKEVTKREGLAFLETVDWTILNEVHILGGLDDSIIDNNLDKDCCYYYEKYKWLLIIGTVEQNKIFEYISRCTQELIELDVRFTDIEKIDLTGCTNIRRLCLAKNNRLRSIVGLDKLKKLTRLDFKNTLIDVPLELDNFVKLRSLWIRNTPINKIYANNVLPYLGYFDAANTKISDASFLSMLPALEQLNLSGTQIKKLPEDVCLNQLKILNVSNTEISSIFSVYACSDLRNFNVGSTNIECMDQYIFPPNVRTIYLNNTKITKIPNNIGQLTNLRKLVISDLNLLELPDWLLDLKLEFVSDNGYGINLSNTCVKDINMDIFSQPRNIIEAWFSARRHMSESEELRETKVVFLGDGGAGKSLTIQRLLMDGHCPNDFDGYATPGISITRRDYNVDDKNILVHYWDFGGQEILHSMHRMFLTKRTLYVVLINARDNTQDERARYWLHNVKSFANGSPIIMVLNQIDQNPSATVNETALQDLYPNLRKIIKLSAQNDSAEEFNNNLTRSILSEISNLPSVHEPFLNAWTLLKKRLQNMPQYYIDAAVYNKLSVECGVDENEEIRANLLDWFNDLGISFCYRDSSLLSNYMILRPDWITNAIYVILFNGSDKVTNGVIKHETIYSMLNPSEEQKGVLKSVKNDIAYTTTEAEYVLGVIRKFKLSYRLDDDTEFIPMLCDRNEKTFVGEYVREQYVLELHMEYDYLPNNVLHRLMVELRSQLDIENVWLTGAFFSESSLGLSALVKTEDNTLKIFAKSTNSLYSANTYLGLIKNSVDRINKQLGLAATCKIVYKENSKSDIFGYEYLLASYEHGNREIYSGAFNKNLSIENILRQSDRDLIEKNQKLLEDVINACKSMQNNKMYWDASEDQRNTYIRDMLRAKDYYISDQTFGGKSGTGKNPGELDIEIRESSDKQWAIYEALNIHGMNQADKNNLNEHLKKVLNNYNPVGCPVLFLVSYLECNKTDFKDIWLKYVTHIKEYAPDNYSVQAINNSEESSFYIRTSECVYDCAGIPATVYHLCVRLGD